MRSNLFFSQNLLTPKKNCPLYKSIAGFAEWAFFLEHEVITKIFTIVSSHYIDILNFDI